MKKEDLERIKSDLEFKVNSLGNKLEEEKTNWRRSLISGVSFGWPLGLLHALVRREDPTLTLTNLGLMAFGVFGAGTLLAYYNNYAYQRDIKKGKFIIEENYTTYRDIYTYINAFFGSYLAMYGITSSIRNLF